jgi:hypothetical protein
VDYHFARNRKSRFKQIVSKYPESNVHTVSSVDSEYPKPEFVSYWMEQNIDYVFLFNDVIAYNAWKIAKVKGLNKLKFIGVDGLNGPFGGIQLVKEEEFWCNCFVPYRR